MSHVTSSQLVSAGVRIKASVEGTAAHKQLLCAAQDFHDPPGQAWLASLAGRTNTGQQILVELWPVSANVTQLISERVPHILYIEISNSMRTRPVYIEYCCYAPLHQFVTNLLIRILSGQDCIASQGIVCLHQSVTWQSSRRRREKQ